MRWEERAIKEMTLIELIKLKRVIFSINQDCPDGYTLSEFDFDLTELIDYIKGDRRNE